MMLQFLRQELAQLPYDDWYKVVLCYDNMCNVDGLACAADTLPANVLDPPLSPEEQNMWKKITKVIDELHISNHKRSKCHVDYNPSKIAQLGIATNPNTMACEQVFAWLGRFKKILCSMPKGKHHFVLDRLVRRHNSYLVANRVKGRQIRLPAATLYDMDTPTCSE